MPVAEITIINKLGLHARASAKLSQLAAQYQCEVLLSKGSRQINAKSIMGVMMLAAGIAFLWVLRTAGDPKPNVQHEYFDSVIRAGAIATAFWGVFTIAIALYSSKLGNLLEAVNILGSLFYGTILGIFLVAFYIKRIGGKAVFLAAILSEIIVVGIWRLDAVAFLWLNLIGCVFVIVLGLVLQELIGKKKEVA